MKNKLHVFHICNLDSIGIVNNSRALIDNVIESEGENVCTKARAEGKAPIDEFIPFISNGVPHPKYRTRCGKDYFRQ